MSALPLGWVEATVDQLAADEPAALTDGPFGSNLKTSHYTDEGPRVVRLENIGDGAFIDEKAHIAPEHFNRLRRHEARAGDVVIAMLGETLPRACILPEHVGPAIVKADCVRLRPHPDVSGAYVAAALNSHQVRLQARDLVHGVGRPRLGLKWLRTLRLPVAPFPEQRRIIYALESFLTRLDNAVATAERIQRNLRRYRASVLKAAVEGRLVPTEDDLARAQGRDYEPASVLLERILAERRRRWEEAELAWMKAKGEVLEDDRWKGTYRQPAQPDTSVLPALPQGWCWATTDQLFSFVTSGSRGWAKHYSTTGAAFVRIGDLNHDSITLDLSEVQHVAPPQAAEGTRTRVEPGDILISITADVGMVALVPEHLGEAYVNQHVALARPVAGAWRPYLAWFLAARDGGRRQFRGLQRGATKVGLGLDDICAVNVPFPPLREQQRIIEEVERLLSAAASAEETTVATVARQGGVRQAILKWAFEGKLVEQDPNDEPASALLERIHAEREAADNAAGPRPGPRARGKRGSQ